MAKSWTRCFILFAGERLQFMIKTPKTTKELNEALKWAENEIKEWMTFVKQVKEKIKLNKK